ncbi:hypothetical protein Gxy13693_019_004 [Komagataeibacter xylinus NBRC 13693]|uniref:Insertion element IS402-like domain-containing protein n=1 Tax=Komagataeibacter xylinus NBRC 13693 TaxID=1234668 RepID=A0A0D6Q939_KOMXY|nr:hypothetical protein Gxy13693_019_004 [Komagataeibacter xylinus NBRC 13693]
MSLCITCFCCLGARWERIAPYFPLALGVPRLDDRRVLNGIMYVIRNGLQKKDVPEA